MADCLNCKKCIRQEVYNQTWGMFQYTNICSVGVKVIIDGRLNPWNALCDKFEHGKSKIIHISDEEKLKY